MPTLNAFEVKFSFKWSKITNSSLKTNPFLSKVTIKNENNSSALSKTLKFDKLDAVYVLNNVDKIYTALNPSF